MNIYISGIHTDIGKTHFSAAFCHAFNFSYFKLIQAGMQRDAEVVPNFDSNIHTYDDGYFLKTAMSPHIGRKIENANYSAMDIKIPHCENLIIEIAGGLFSPICDRYCMIDYMDAFRNPTILVMSEYLGCINHTLLSIDSLKNRGIEIICLALIAQNPNREIHDFISKYAGVKIILLDRFDKNNFHEKSLKMKEQMNNLGISFN